MAGDRGREDPLPREQIDERGLSPNKDRDLYRCLRQLPPNLQEEKGGKKEISLRHLRLNNHSHSK